MAQGRRRVRARAVLTALAALLAAAAVVAVVQTVDSGRGETPRPHLGTSLRSPLGGTGDGRPNIVFVLTDDLSSDLIRYMPHVQALEQAGMTFTNYTVDDSLCCPSRASILTGRFPHNTGVYANSGRDGGFGLFHRRGEELDTFATRLHDAGYRTALLGKYLNGYMVSGKGKPIGPTVYNLFQNWVPPGWDRWAVSGWGYNGFDYRLNLDHQNLSYGHAPQDYLTIVLQHFGEDFIRSSSRDHQPFLLELSTFSPHGPYVPAMEDQNSFVGTRAPRSPSFAVRPANAPPWLASLPPLNRALIARIDEKYRRRVQSVQSIDRAIDAFQRTLAEVGELSNTVFIFNSDNGYHMGEHGLAPGKMTAFDSDINVPLVVAGPGVAAGSVNRNLVQNADLAPTFEDIAGAGADRRDDGRSIVPLLRGRTDGTWRTAALVEHHGPDLDPHDPDAQRPIAGNPPSYEALRTARFTYVRYYDGEHEYYDRSVDPYELVNRFASLPPGRVAALDAQLAALHHCRGAHQCWRAGRLDTAQ